MTPSHGPRRGFACSRSTSQDSYLKVDSAGLPSQLDVFLPTARKASILNLESLGWNPEWDKLRADIDPNWEVGRIVRQDVNRFLIFGTNGETSAILRGRARVSAGGDSSQKSLPSVGDWVAVSGDESGTVVIEHVFKRKSAFVRKVAGETTEEQVLAANVDTAFLVIGLDDDFNPRRIERYLTATWESGANPVIVLNKADSSNTLQAQIATVEGVALGVPVVAVSALTRAGIESLDPWLGPGQTVALLGSSGVGKSTLINSLVGSAHQETGGVRESDSKGRHTTTHREIVPLPGGALLIDTPGMRELQAL